MCLGTNWLILLWDCITNAMHVSGHNVQYPLLIATCNATGHSGPQFQRLSNRAIGQMLV